MIENKNIKKVLAIYKDIWSLNHLYALADWDINTYMPEKSITPRSEALGRLGTIIQKMYLGKEITKLIINAEKSKTLSVQEKAIIRIIKKSIREYEKLPPSFVEEFENLRNKSQLSWRDARKNENFKLFEDDLVKLVQLTRRKAEYLGYPNHPYDALIDEYDEGWTTRDTDKYFGSLIPQLKVILDKIPPSKLRGNTSPLETMKYSQSRMQDLNHKVLKYLQFPTKKTRLDIAPHPFTSSLFSNKDVRITTWYHPRNFARSLCATIHEFGHALYELQCPNKFEYMPISGGASMSIHESQSRFWENIVGRNTNFLNNFLLEIKNLSSDISKELETDTIQKIYKYFNTVKPGNLRVEADELTYHFHIALRFDIEKKLFGNKLKVKDLPEVWNNYMKKYLGIIPQKPSEGVLQDIHWSMGAFGYFPTYSIGTSLSIMWKESLEQEIGLIDNLVQNVDGIKKIQAWHKNHIHSYASIYKLKELIKVATGKSFSTEPVIKYLTKKYTP